MEYGNYITNMCTLLEMRITTNNPSNPLTIYRQSKSNSTENLVAEMDVVMRAYYQLIDDCKDHKEWQLKIEEDVGSRIAFLMTNVDESNHDLISSYSPAFARFVSTFGLTPQRTKTVTSSSSDLFKIILSLNKLSRTDRARTPPCS